MVMSDQFTMEIHAVPYPKTADEAAAVLRTLWEYAKKDSTLALAISWTIGYGIYKVTLSIPCGFVDSDYWAAQKRIAQAIRVALAVYRNDPSVAIAHHEGP